VAQKVVIWNRQLFCRK